MNEWINTFMNKLAVWSIVVVVASTLWMPVHFRNFRNARVSLPPPNPTPPPPTKEQCGGTANRSEAGCLLTDEWARAGSPCSVATSQTKSFSPLLHAAKNTRETTPREVTPKVRDVRMLCRVSLHRRFSHFAFFLSYLVAFYERCGSSLRLQTIEELLAALASSPAFNPLPPPI